MFKMNNYKVCFKVGFELNFRFISILINGSFKECQKKKKKKEKKKEKEIKKKFKKNDVNFSSVNNVSSSGYRLFGFKKSVLQKRFAFVSAVGLIVGCWQQGSKTQGNRIILNT